MAGLGLVSPGIKVREVDLTRGGITGVSDQTGAIAGPFVKGPINEPILIENEKDLVDTFGEPKDTNGQYEYWMSASSYLSYGGVLRVVRIDGQDLNNANSAVSGGSSVTSGVKIKNIEDYYGNYDSATDWYWAAKNPGIWANGIRVCVLDGRADQVLSGLNTAGVAVGAAVTQVVTGNVGGIGTAIALDGHLKGIVTGIGASSLEVKVVSRVAASGTEYNVDYVRGGSYEFDTNNALNIPGATGSATTSITIERLVAGTTVGEIGIGTALLVFDNVSETTIDNAGGAAVAIGATGAFLANASGISTIGAGSANLLLIGTEVIGVGETINTGTGFVGFSTRGLEGTSPTAHNDGSTVTVLSNAGSATTVAADAASGATTLVVNSLGSGGQVINTNDFLRVTSVGVGTTAEFVKVTGSSVSGTLTPTSTADWFESQTLGLDNSTVYWKNVAPRPGTSAYANERNSRFDEIHVVVVDDKGTITGNSGQILEKHVGLSKAKDAKRFNNPIYYKDYVADNSEYLFGGFAPNGTPTGFSTGTTAFSASASAWGQDAQGIVFAGIGRSVYDLQGGKDYNGGFTEGLTATLGDIIEGYDQFANKREYPVNYLIMGPSEGNRANTQAKANKLVNIAENRKDCVATISPDRGDVLANDVPKTNSDQQTNNVITTLDGVNSSSYAVLDSGYAYKFDRFNNKFRYVPCNADVAGMMARTSQNSFPWFSPAGVTRGTVNNAVKLAYNPSQAQRDLLYSRRINPVIAQPGQGILLFGDKTALSYTSAFDRINVRRLFLTIEVAIERAARAQLFEFNDAITRSNFVNIVEPFLRDVQGKRGITDFLVVCDETNNTPDVIDANEFRADIFVKPARSINFIGLTFVATRTGISFEEVVGTV